MEEQELPECKNDLDTQVILKVAALTEERDKLLLQISELERRERNRLAQIEKWTERISKASQTERLVEALQKEIAAVRDIMSSNGDKKGLIYRDWYERTRVMDWNELHPVKMAEELSMPEKRKSEVCPGCLSFEMPHTDACQLGK